MGRCINLERKEIILRGGFVRIVEESYMTLSFILGRNYLLRL